MTKTKTTNQKEEVKITKEVPTQNPKLKDDSAEVGEVLISENTVNPTSKIDDRDAEIKLLKQKISDLTHFEKENVSFKGELAAKDDEIELLKQKISGLTHFGNENVSLKGELSGKDVEIEDLKLKLSEALPVKPKEMRIAVHHGVVIGTKTYSKKDIEANEEIQNYLLASKSTAVSTVD